MELEEAGSPTSDYSTKLQSSIQYDTVEDMSFIPSPGRFHMPQKQKYRPMEKGRKPRNKPMFL